MFTGIINSTALVDKISIGSTDVKIKVNLKKNIKVKRGDSVSINGVCLTATQVEIESLFFDVMKETMDKTNLLFLKKGMMVNVEPALAVDSLLGGHFVQGHVDNIAEVAAIKKEGNHWLFSFKAAEVLVRDLFPKVSVAVNGVSLTIVEVGNDSFSVAVIPTTYQDTNFSQLKIADKVNVELDVFGKYVKHFLVNSKKKEINREFLYENGF